MTAIFRADGAFGLIAALEADFGAIALMPIHPKPEADRDPRAGRRREGQPRAAGDPAGADPRGR